MGTPGESKVVFGGHCGYAYVSFPTANIAAESGTETRIWLADEYPPPLSCRIKEPKAMFDDRLMQSQEKGTATGHVQTALYHATSHDKGDTKH